jgi:hypothetical protein
LNPREEKWERYFCEICSFYSDKLSDVDRHKDNVHAKQQQSDFATYVTRTLMKTLVNILAGKFKKRC